MATRLFLVEIQRSSGALGPYCLVLSCFILREFHWASRWRAEGGLRRIKRASAGKQAVSSHPSPHRRPRLGPAHSEGQYALQQVRVIYPVVLGRCRELLAFCDFGVGIGFDEIGHTLGGEAEVDAGVAVELQDPVDALRRALNAGIELR